MKLDDRDIVCETDYSPLSNEELAAQIEWHAAAMSGVSAYVLERITGPARALMARVEADEAEVVDLHRQLVEMATAMEEIEAERLSLAARVAELEAQLAAQWRPVTEKPTEPPDGETSEYLTWNDFVGFTVRRYHDGQFHSAFRKQPTHWRPLPPAPQETP